MKILSALSKLIKSLIIILSISYATPLIAAAANSNNNSTSINSSNFKPNHNFSIAESSQNTQDYQSPIFTNFSYPPTS